MGLDDLQRNLAASLAGRRDAPEGLDARALERTRTALEAKRRQAAFDLLPRLHQALGPEWTRRFHRHAAVYNPTGMRHHVDDAWAFAEAVLRERDPRLAGAARDDLLALRLRWARDQRRDADRIRERRGPVAGVMRLSRKLIVRLPGVRGRTFQFQIPVF